MRRGWTVMQLTAALPADSRAWNLSHPRHNSSSTIHHARRLLNSWWILTAIKNWKKVTSVFSFRSFFVDCLADCCNVITWRLSSSAVCLYRECIVTKWLKLESRDFHWKIASFNSNYDDEIWFEGQTRVSWSPYSCRYISETVWDTA